MRAKYLYIVCDLHDPLALCPGNYSDEPPGGLLMISQPLTVFTDRRKAKRAIARTKAYSKRHNLPWGDRYYIYRLGKPQ